MKISDLPVALNQAKPYSQLTQYQATGQKTQTFSNNTADTAKFTLSLVSSDNDYAKQDAVLKQWNKEGSFNLYEVWNGGKVNLQNPNPSIEELREFEKQLQQNGIHSDIDWSNFEFDLKGLGFSTDNPTYRLSADDFNRKTDYLASRYAALKDKIKNNFFGEELSSQLEYLDSLYQSALDEIARGYSNIVGGFLVENGVAGEQEKIYNSVVNGIHEKAQEYEKYLAENPDFAGLKDTADEWLLTDDEYVASLLRNKNVETSGSTKDAYNEDYSMKDLDILGRYVSELTVWESHDATYSMDEGQIGLDFAMLSMKTDSLRKNGNISSALDSTLQKMLDGFMNGFLDRVDSKLTDLRNEGSAVGDKEGYAALDRQIIWNVYNKTIERYRVSGDALDALIHGAKYGVTQALGKTNTRTYSRIRRSISDTPYSSPSPQNRTYQFPGIRLKPS